MRRVKKIAGLMAKGMGVQAVAAFIISMVWLFIEMRKGTDVVGIKTMAFAFLNAFFFLGLLCATIAVVKIWWDFFWLKRDLSKDIKAQIALEGNDAPVPEVQDMDTVRENKLIFTREKTWELAFILLGVLDFAISYALSIALYNAR